MKKILLLIIILILLLIPKVNASTTSASSYILMDETTGRVLLSKDMNSNPRGVTIHRKSGTGETIIFKLGSVEINDNFF